MRAFYLIDVNSVRFYVKCKCTVHSLWMGQSWVTGIIHCSIMGVAKVMFKQWSETICCTVNDFRLSHGNSAFFRLKTGRRSLQRYPLTHQAASHCFRLCIRTTSNAFYETKTKKKKKKCILPCKNHLKFLFCFSNSNCSISEGIKDTF